MKLTKEFLNNCSIGTILFCKISKNINWELIKLSNDKIAGFIFDPCCQDTHYIYPIEDIIGSHFKILDVYDPKITKFVQDMEKLLNE